MYKSSALSEVENDRMARSDVGLTVMVMLAYGLALAGRAEVARGQVCLANEFQKLQASDGAEHDDFGNSVSISGNVVLVGARYDDDFGTSSGSTYIFRFDGLNWNQEAKLLPSDGGRSDKFGFSVSIDGDVALVGSVYDTNENGTNAGSAYIFRFDGLNWNQEAKLIASDGEDFHGFSWSLWISGDVAIIGTFADNHNGSHSGAAYIFRFDGSNWNQEAKLLASDGTSDDFFGWSVSISGDAAIVGAQGDDNENGTDSGSAYIFRFDGTNWNEEAKLLGSDGASVDLFGGSVSISGDVALVGADMDDEDIWDCGSAYVFRFDGSIWTQEAKLLASDRTEHDRFGSSVSLDSETALVGAYMDDDNGDESGSVYVYRFDGTQWYESTKLLASDGTANDFLGWTVSISGDMSIVGSVWNQDNEINPGSAYTFRGLGDCNGNRTVDICDIAFGTSEDCQPNGIPDECDIADGGSKDANGNGIPDECEGCTGQERIRKLKCRRQQNGTNKLTVKLANGRADDTWVVELSTGDVKNGIVGSNGKAKVKFKRQPSGDGVATAMWGCGAVDARGYSCP